MTTRDPDAAEWRHLQAERLAAALAAHLPAAGERFTIRWPDGPYDFVMEFAYEDLRMAGAPDGWTYLHGAIVEPESWYRQPWSLMVHWVDGEDGGAWTMLPKDGKLSDTRTD